MRPWTGGAAVLAACCWLAAAPGRAQDSAPLAPYTPAPAPAAAVPDATAPADGPLGDVRARSDSASNISGADTRSPIAPALPDPDARADDPRAYLAAARTALLTGQTGQAQEALERAEARLLSRDVAPSAAGTPSGSPAIAAVGRARQAVGAGDREAALKAIGEAMGAL